MGVRAAVLSEWLRAQMAWIGIPVLPLIICVTLDKLLKFSVPWSPHL